MGCVENTIRNVQYSDTNEDNQSLWRVKEKDSFAEMSLDSHKIFKLKFGGTTLYVCNADVVVPNSPDNSLLFISVPPAGLGLPTGV